jgi:hypothetical protein
VYLEADYGLVFADLFRRSNSRRAGGHASL